MDDSLRALQVIGLLLICVSILLGMIPVACPHDCAICTRDRAMRARERRHTEHVQFHYRPKPDCEWCVSGTPKERS